jgi:hypothetical protein
LKSQNRKERPIITEQLLFQLEREETIKAIKITDSNTKKEGEEIRRE